MQFGKSNFSFVQGTSCAAAVLLQISAVLFPNAPSLSVMFWVSMSNTFLSKEERRTFFAGGISVKMIIYGKKYNLE